MKNLLLKLTTLSLIASSAIYANGYKVPENSVSSVSLLAANIAHSSGADTAYYNPANMAFMKDENNLELGLMLISVESSKFDGKGEVAKEWITADHIESESELPIIPSIHFVSSKYNNFTFGFSMVVPSGVTKEWEVRPAKDKAEQFTLEVIELNPTVAYKINDKMAIALGLRALKSSGIVKSTSSASRDMEGESFDFGYNLALAYKPTSALEIGVTYRSKVNLEEEGNAKLYIGNAKVYDGGGSVEVPLPAQFNLAVAYTFDSQTTLEVVYEKSFWSAYKTLDFNYISNIPAILQPSMDNPISKDWEDTITFRIGVTQELNELTLMAGLTIDETPIPDKSLSFELPGTDSTAISFGAKYKVNENLTAGFGMLCSMKESRKVINEELQGEFASGETYIFSTGIGYKF